MTYHYDFLIIGGGVAGMSFALKVANAHKGSVAIICKTTLDEANTAKAQGGIASVTNLAVDNFDKHIHDTMVAGDWLSDPKAVEHVVRNAPDAKNYNTRILYCIHHGFANKQFSPLKYSLFYHICYFVQNYINPRLQTKGGRANARPPKYRTF